MTSPAYFNSIQRIIRDGMTNAGLLEELQDPTPEQFARYKDRLTDLINAWITQGLRLWLMEDLSITLTAGTATYVLGPGGSFITSRPYRVLQGYFLDTSANRRPIFPMSWDEYLTLSNTSTQGPVTQFLVDKQATNLNVTFWLTPDSTAATGTAHLFLEQQAQQPISLLDTTGFPPEWYMALHWGLASEICTGQPQSVIQRCEQKAAYWFDMLNNWDVEDAATRFTPDTTRGSFGRRSFL